MNGKPKPIKNPKKGKVKVESVDACAGDAGSCKIKNPKRVIKSFNPNKSRYNLGKAKEERTQATNQTHMNMRDLSGGSGDVSYYGGVGQPSGSNDGSKMKKLELNRSKSRRFFGK